MAPYIRVWDDSTREGIDAIYGLVQVVAGPSVAVSDIVWEALEEGLTNHHGSFTITRYLQNTMESVHANLAGYSVRGWRASAVLAAISGTDVYLAWAGPAVSWVVTKERLYYPGYVTPDTAGGALGDEGNVPIYVAQEQVENGDVLVLGWSQLLDMIEEDSVTTLIRSGIDPATRSLYRMASEESEFALLMLQLNAA